MSGWALNDVVSPQSFSAAAAATAWDWFDIGASMQDQPAAQPWAAWSEGVAFVPAQVIIPAVLAADLTMVPESDYASILKADGVLHEEVFGQTYEIPPEANMFEFVVDRKGFPKVDGNSELVIKVKAELSLDSGQTWELLCAGTTTNAPVYNPLLDGNGNVIGRGDERFDWHGFVGIRGRGMQGRLVRAFIVPIKGLRTSLTCRFSDLTVDQSVFERAA